MTGQKRKNSENEEGFAALIDSYSPIVQSELRVGDKVQGRIISIGADFVFVDINSKIDGIVEISELLDENHLMSYKVGDSLELYVVAVRDDDLRLSKALSGMGSPHLLRDAYEKEIPVEGKIIETCKGGFQVEIMGRRAFCPVSQVDLSYVEHPEKYVGVSHRFLISKFDMSDNNIVLSRRELLNQELEKSKKQFFETLKLGHILDGKVTKIMPYGAFVELAPGVEGLVHISELSWSKSVGPNIAVSVGQSVQVKVIGVEPDEGSKSFQISLSIKQLTEDPWNLVGDRFQEGDKLKGKITRCVSFGAFVEIASGIEGLVHISEMSYTKRVLKPEEIVTPGEIVSVLIKEMDLKDRRISLSIRDAEGDPWLEVLEKFSIGQTIEGSIERKEKFGYFISLTPGITGLLPKSKISQSHQSANIEKLPEGCSISVIIKEISTKERKITLAPAASEDERDWQEFVKDTPTSMSPLAEKLQLALASKKQT